ncbi:uncharacterized protein LOC110820800 isoform X2 [Carica papaya]|uniref:uncharacterized protein LOC110820800 isoform X2 n=1 Tax=Carica papaya TaxID=3649 RepID=UPI000B8CF8B9|nr:uncharacterized protein LOC110820800 isoform X2 [Carica papaya]
MTILRLGFKIPFAPQHRVISIPWVNKNTEILCLKGRNFTSSAPVGYSPKKSRKGHESENFLPLGGSERDKYHSTSGELEVEIAKNGRHTGRHLFLDVKNQNRNGTCKLDTLHAHSKQEFGDDEFTEDPEDVVEEMITSEVENFHKQDLQAGETMKIVENSAIKVLATRAFTSVELRKKLHGKRFPSDVIERVIDSFKSRGLINDSLYAESFSQSRWSSASWGPMRIKQALLKKGISQADAEKAVKLVFEDSESSEAQESTFGLSKLSMDHLYIQASKQWFRGQDVPKETRKSRIIRWLQYRGFNWGVISFILKKLESECPH